MHHALVKHGAFALQNQNIMTTRFKDLKIGEDVCAFYYAEEPFEPSSQYKPMYELHAIAVTNIKPSPIDSQSIITLGNGVQLQVYDSLSTTDSVIDNKTGLRIVVSTDLYELAEERNLMFYDNVSGRLHRHDVAIEKAADAIESTLKAIEVKESAQPGQDVDKFDDDRAKAAYFKYYGYRQGAAINQMLDTVAMHTAIKRKAEEHKAQDIEMFRKFDTIMDLIDKL
jgi:hypothetical protein